MELTDLFSTQWKDIHRQCQKYCNKCIPGPTQQIMLKKSNWNSGFKLYFFFESVKSVATINHKDIPDCIREAAKKVLFFSGPATKTGVGEVRARPLRKKELFFYIFTYFSPKIVETFFWSKSVSGYFKTKKIKTEKKFLWPLSRGGGGLRP